LYAEKGIGESLVNLYKENDKILLSKVKSSGDVKGDILKAVNLIGGFEKTLQKGDEILLKPNFNSADPPPASSDPEFVKAMIELLYEHGAAKVILGESSMQFLSTKKVLEKIGMTEIAKEAGAEIVIFDKEKWVKVPVGGKYVKSVGLPETALRAKKLVCVCNMKTHSLARFSMSLKLAFGFVKRRQRIRFHMGKLQKKIADLNLVVHPNLIVMDGRQCFIAGGPFKGEVRTPDLVLASGDRVSIDVEGIKVIESFEGADLKNDPWSYDQIKRAVELGIGAKSSQDYKVITE